jgi:hypothetical protein
MSAMIDQLDRIRDRLSSMGRDQTVARLLPPLAPDEIIRRFDVAGLPAPASLVELYSWRNGTHVQPGTNLDDVHFFPGFWFLSLDDALQNYAAFRSDNRWDPRWLPVFANGGGDFYAAVLEEPTPVVGFVLNEADHPIEYESLEAMIATLDEAFRDGAHFVDDRGFLEVDDQRYAEIARRHNPGVGIW